MAIGRKTGGGSRKGKPNKVPAAIRTMIEQALSEIGGVEYLKTQAEKNPAAFLTLVGKVLPLQISGVASEPLTIQWINYADAVDPPAR